MATWPERFTELHQSSRPKSSPLRSARPHDLGSAEVCRNVANISFSTEPLRKCCLRLFKTSVMVVGYNFPIWSKMMSIDFQWNANENYENSVLCISSLPWTPQTLLKKLKQLPATNYNLTPTKKCFPWEKNRTCDSWGWCARWTLSPMGSTVMGTKIIKIVGKRLVNGSSFELAIYHGF